MLEPSSTKERLTNYFMGLFIILLGSGGGLTIAQSILLPGSSKLERASGSMAVQAIWSTLYLCVFLLLWPHRHEAWRRLKASPWLIALIAFALASMAWSDFPGLTLRRTIAVCCTTMTGLYFSIRYRPREFLVLLAYATLVAACLSIVCVFLLPDYSVEPYRGAPAWNGIYPQKNLLAKAMMFGIIGWAILAVEQKGWTRFNACIGLALCLLVFRQSHSAFSSALLIACCGLAVIGAISRYTPSHSAILFSLFAGMLAVFGFLLLDIPTHRLEGFFVEWSGRDTTLTGRTVLWSILWEDVQESPLLGYGFSAYWLGERGPSEATMLLLQQQGIDEVMTHSHNGFIDIVLNLGCLGLGIYLVWTFRMTTYALRLIRKPGSSERYFPLFFIILFLTYNLTEREILFQHSLCWAVLCMISFDLHARQSPPKTGSAYAELQP